MPYDPNFIPGLAVPLPRLGQSVEQDAFNAGAPVDHTHFSIIFNEARGFAHVVAHNIDGANTVDVTRSDRFRFDEDIPNAIQVDRNRGYRNNPWDQGHLARRVSLLWGPAGDAFIAEHESFFWSNIAPQHEGLHDGPWGSIEDWVLDLADAADVRACVFTGPVFTDEDPLITNRPSEEPIQIPAGFWKIVVIRTGGVLQAAGFLVWQRDFDGDTPLEFDPILEQVRITTLEYLTGLSFGELRAADPLMFGSELTPPAGPAAGPAAPIAPAIPRIALSRASSILTRDDLFMPAARARMR